jgi:hypothetical protein
MQSPFSGILFNPHPALSAGSRMEKWMSWYPTITKTLKTSLIFKKQRITEKSRGIYDSLGIT